MCNLHWCYTFALVLRLNCTALSQSESSNFFMYIIIIIIIIINAFTVLQTSLTMHVKNLFTIFTLLTCKTEELLIMTYTLRYLKNLQ